MRPSVLLFIVCMLAAAGSAHGAFTEPTMGDYAAFPIFSDQSVKPNIMIVLDNSGSMNEMAYSGGFEGAPYSVAGYPVIGLDDDMEGAAAPDVSPDTSGAGGVNDLDMGEYPVGLRFQNVQIPRNATITHAWIDFVASDTDSEGTDLLIEGEASDNAAPFTAANPITNRAATSAVVQWQAIPGWTNGQTYTSPDIGAIVQEIVNRGGWTQGSAMAFRVTGKGQRDARSRNASDQDQPVLRIETDAIQGRRYYGYFDPDSFYEYNSNIFEVAYKKVSYSSASGSWSVRSFDPAGDSGKGSLSATTTTLSGANIVTNRLWDGNWLNWVCMRRVDVLRKVIVGGLSNSRQGGGKQSVNGEDPYNTSHGNSWSKSFNSTDNMPVNPFHGSYTYDINNNGTFSVRNANTTRVIKVQKEPVIEPLDFDEDGELAGVFQRIGDKARWGNTWFNDGNNDSRQNGGRVATAIDGSSMASMISTLQGERCDTSTPLAETLYVVMQYFKQENIQGGLNYPNNCLPDPVKQGGEKDPYYNSGLKEKVPCAKSFVILLTDGGSTRDGVVPGFLKDTDGDGDNTNVGDGSSDYLDDVAYYAHINDLRADMEGDQVLTLYTIFAFANDNTARALLRDAAKNGGFDDRDGNKKPNLREEWDKDLDDIPDTYFEADDGYALENRLLAAITDILKRAASGTASSVLSTNNQGAGNSIQAYFKPLVTEGLEDAKWLGYMQSLWVDPWGNLREDTNGNKRLDLKNTAATNTAEAGVDKIVSYLSESGSTKIRRYSKHFLYNPQYDGTHECETPPYDCGVESEVLAMEAIAPIYEVGKNLSLREPDTRKIYTGIDSDKNGVVTNMEVVEFTKANATALTPYLGVRDGGAWGATGADLGDSHENRVDNIIEWIRGRDVEGLRNRTLAGVTWRLGDIVHSTPMTVGPAKEFYHQLYADKQYLAFLQHTKDRETMIYAGANDGMLHAFTSGISKKDDKNNIWYEKKTGTAEAIGDELWAYIPMSVLPHLKWTAHKDYSHTYYVDGPVRVFDAKILPDDTYYTDGDGDPNFGTFIVFGLNMGGKKISVFEDFGGVAEEERIFYPTYVMMDITDPRNPKLMWERTYPELGLTTVTPSPMHVGKRTGAGKWYLAFGSGPTNYQGESTQEAHLYVVDMLTGAPYGAGGKDWLATSSKKSYFSDILALDLFQSHNTDALFVANNYYQGNGNLASDIWKIAVPCTQCEWDVDQDGIKKWDLFDDELVYNNNPSSWLISKDFFIADGPVSAAMTSTMDDADNLLIFFGTGRYLSENDKESQGQQYLYGIKDPFYNKQKYKGGYYHNFGQTLSLKTTDLFNASNATAVMANAVRPVPSVIYPGGNPSFVAFKKKIRDEEDGWYQKLKVAASTPSERIVSQVAILGGAAVTPAFMPSKDVCGLGGDTVLMGVYYETGTGGERQFFDIAEANLRYTDVGGKPAEIVEIRDDTIFHGMPSPKPVFHTGMEGGAALSFQLGTGEVGQEQTRPYLYFPSIITEWWDDPKQAPPLNSECKW